VADVEAAVAGRLAKLLDASPAVIYSFEAKGDFAPTFVSDNIARLFGYAAVEYLDNPNFWRERVHPEDLPRLEAEMGALFETGQHVSEYRFRKKDGSYCWVNDEQHLVRDEEGAPSEVVGSWSDISVRKAAEDAEDRTRARLALLFDTAPAVIICRRWRRDHGVFRRPGVQGRQGGCAGLRTHGNRHAETLARAAGGMA
jgi:adenylate cyclase